MVKSEFSVVGVMSGTSLDGIDLVYTTLRYNQKWNYHIHAAETIKYPTDWLKTLRKLVEYGITKIKEIDVNYTHFLGITISDFIVRNRISHIDFVSSHGHTALHQPENKLTYQIGNRQLLSDILNCKVICDFRVQDVALGGQGAPLVPIGDHLLFSEYDYCLNLGGFANISFLKHSNRIAFDICPANIVLNYFAKYLNLDFDNCGKLASEGNLNNDLLRRLNTLDYYNLNAPKSLGLEWVKLNFLPLISESEKNVKDILRTLVEHITIQISKILKSTNRRTLVTGGGAYNTFLIERLMTLSESKIIIPNKKLIEFKEALIFSFLGALKVRNEINCLKSVTGASKDHVSGKIFTPKTKNKI